MNEQEFRNHKPQNEADISKLAHAISAIDNEVSARWFRNLLETHKNEPGWGDALSSYNNLESILSSRFRRISGGPAATIEFANTLKELTVNERNADTVNLIIALGKGLYERAVILDGKPSGGMRETIYKHVINATDLLQDKLTAMEFTQSPPINITPSTVREVSMSGSELSLPRRYSTSESTPSEKSEFNQSSSLILAQLNITPQEIRSTQLDTPQPEIKPIIADAQSPQFEETVTVTPRPENLSQLSQKIKGIVSDINLDLKNYINHDEPEKLRAEIAATTMGVLSHLDDQLKNANSNEEAAEELKNANSFINSAINQLQSKSTMGSPGRLRSILIPATARLTAIAMIYVPNEYTIEMQKHHAEQYPTTSSLPKADK